MRFPHSLGSAWMIPAAVFLTLSGALVKSAAQNLHMNAYELVFWRVLFAVVFLAAQALLLKRSFRTAVPLQHLWRSLAGTGGLMLFFYGLAHLPLGTAVTLNYTSAIFLALLSVWLLKERPSAQVWAALLSGMAGIVLILQPSLQSGQFQAALLCLGSGLCSGYAYLKVRELSLSGEPAWRIVFYFSLTAAVVSAAAATWQGWTRPPLHGIATVAGIGLTALAGQLALTHAYKIGQKFTVAALSYLTVALSALYGAAVFGDVLTWADALGIALIIVGGIVSSLR